MISLKKLSTLRSRGLSGLAAQLCQRRYFCGYGKWIAENEDLSGQKLSEMRQKASGLTGPLLSVVMPVFNPPKTFLREALQSVLDQTWSLFELCICDDGSTEPHVREVLSEFASKDSRLRLFQSPAREGIACASNKALGLAKGEFTLFFDHDDVLSPVALQRVAQSIVENPGSDFFYSDEDKLDEKGRRCFPHFKPDFDPVLLLSQNYICHLSAVRTAVLTEVGGFREGFEGAQDWDLFFRCLERGGKVVHIPEVLYHWRISRASTALSSGAKPNVLEAQEKSVGAHLERTGFRGSVGIDTGNRRVKVDPQYPEKARLSVVYAEGMKVDPCTRKVIKHGEVADVDDSPDSDVLCFVSCGLKAATPGWLGALLGWALTPKVGFVGPAVMNGRFRFLGTGLKNGQKMHQDRLFCDPGYMGRESVPHLVEAVMPEVFVVRRKVLQALGISTIRSREEAIELSKMAGAKGFYNIYVPFAKVRT